jgi:phage terminase large subunit
MAMSKGKLRVQLPAKMYNIFDGKARYRCAYGGRGSGKTRSFAIMTAVRGMELAKAGKSGIILCAREFMNSLADSSFEEIKQAIMSDKYLESFYDIGQNYIRTKDGRISYAFAGLRRNLDSLKGRGFIHICWIDEAETVSEMAWAKLIPTVREEDSEIWVSWNPESKLSPTHKRFREETPDDCKIVEINYSDNDWFPEVLNQERLEDKKKRPDSYEWIWLGNFLTHHDGAYYNIELRDARDEGRITIVPYDRALPVVTAWDLGIGDSTAITFAQFHGSEVRIIDFYENSGVGLDHYARVLQDRGYRYDQHILPHDVRVKELGSGKSRYETLQSLGINPITIAPQLQVDDGIQAVRSMLPLCWFDAEKCDHLVEALRAYHREYDDQRMTWKGRPEHDWSSHPADSFRYLAVGYRERNSWKGGAIKRNIQGIA